MSHEEMFKDIFKVFRDFTKSMNQEVGLAAIWYHKPLVYDQEKKQWTCRITEGDEIRIENGKPEPATLESPATHKIIGCYGAINDSTHSIQVVSLKTGEPEIIKL